MATPKRSLSPGAVNTYSVMNEIILNAINTNVNGVMYAFQYFYDEWCFFAI